MNAVELLLIVLCLMFGFLACGLWMGISLGLAGALSILLFTGYPLGDIVAKVSFSANDSFVLAAVPFFILMGELLFHSGISQRLYSGITPWIARIPGRLLHTNVIVCSIFAAMVGTSAAPTAAVASIALPELKQRGYDEKISIASLAGAGTLGLLIPPSAGMIIYGAMVGDSVGQLFMAGVLPGLMLASFFMIYIAIVSIAHPSIVPPKTKTYSWKERFVAIRQVIPAFFVIASVLGLIYGGVVTPTESAAIGVLASACVCLLHRTMSWKMLKTCLIATARLTCMILFIITGASILRTAVAYLRIPNQLASFVVSLELSPYVILTILILLYLGMGCVFDGISMMVLTLPIVHPVITTLGFSSIWFAVILIILTEAAQITPPVGFNLFVLEKISGVPIFKIGRYSIPFLLLMILAIVVLTLFPDIALWLPSTMTKAVIK